MLHRFMLSGDGATVNVRGLEPSLLLMSRGVCGPKPLHSVSASAGLGSAAPAASTPATTETTTPRISSSSRVFP